MPSDRRMFLGAGLGVTAALASRASGLTTAAQAVSSESPPRPGNISLRYRLSVPQRPAISGASFTGDRAPFRARVGRRHRPADARGRGEKVKVAARGQGHSTYGRPWSKTDCGRHGRDRRRSAGCVGSCHGRCRTTWRSVLDATLKQGLAPPVLTNYLGLTVGGTISVGGIGGSLVAARHQTDQSARTRGGDRRGPGAECSPASIAICSTLRGPGLGSAASSPGRPCGWCGRPGGFAGFRSSIPTCPRLPPTSVAYWLRAASPSCRAR